MDDKLCVVTGGNAGIGKAIVTALAQRQAQVVFVSRDARRGQEALAEILQEAPDGRVEMVVGDLGTIASTQRLAEALLAKLPAIHVLINNAGIWMTKRVLNEDGLELTFMVNHLAPFILTNHLLPRLQASAPARIVNVNAGLYVNGRLDLQRTPTGQDFSRIRTYADSKLANVLFTRELASRITGSGVTVNAVHPGVIRTNLGVSPGAMGFILGLVKRFWQPPAEGADAPVWLATAPEAAAANGRYFVLREETPVTSVAQDDDLARQLWTLSEELVASTPQSEMI